ncbi:hypothetical protein E4U13_003214, partial [Claviceps humidiphila]
YGTASTDKDKGKGKGKDRGSLIVYRTNNPQEWQWERDELKHACLVVAAPVLLTTQLEEDVLTLVPGPSAGSVGGGGMSNANSAAHEKAEEDRKSTVGGSE